MFQIFRHKLSNLKLKKQILLNRLHQICIKINTKILIKYNKPCSIFDEIEQHIKEKKLCSSYKKMDILYVSLYNYYKILNTRHEIYKGPKICILTFKRK